MKNLAAGEFLKKPYTRTLIPDNETGTYTAQILEFPGCVAQGNTPAEAYGRLEAAAESWIEAALEMGQEIPEPASDAQFSGRFALRLPRGLHRQAAQMAEWEGTSLNQFITTAIAEKVGAVTAYRGLERQLAAYVARTVTPRIGPKSHKPGKQRHDRRAAATP
jgi:predicted RNase H-like HicB family nuclease